MTLTPSGAPDRSEVWRNDGTTSHEWVNLDRAAISRRYDHVARILPLFDWLFFMPRGFRPRAVGRLKLKPGSRVLEIGCGTGRNLAFLQAAVGPSGTVYGVDISPGMLAKARALCARNAWSNVSLMQQDAVDFAPPEPLDGVIFGLSYNTMPHHLAVLHHAWSLLRPRGRLVVMDAKLPPGLGGRLILPFSLWLMKRTMLGNPLIKPWEDMTRLAGTIEMEQFMFGSWYICATTKPDAAA
ncbi:MAG: methyltransferase domain-containing protein [Hyphomicrobiales bacterium]|nr:methyltransferase domain-containing protein [Hyphomicrobiales bacterium]